jgi:hypothetical protein
MYVGMDVHRKRSQIAIIDAAGDQQRNRNVPNVIPPGFCGGSIAWKAGWSHGTQLEFPPGPEALPARAA